MTSCHELTEPFAVARPSRLILSVYVRFVAARFKAIETFNCHRQGMEGYIYIYVVFFIFFVVYSLPADEVPVNFSD